MTSEELRLDAQKLVKRLIEIKMKENPSMTRKQAIQALKDEEVEEV